MVDVVCVGSAVMDYFVLLPKAYLQADAKNSNLLDECFVLGAKHEVKRIIQQSGGGATNAALTFHRQSLSTLIMSKVGSDGVGRQIIEELENEGLKTEHFVKTSAGTSGQSIILVDPNGERTILTDRGTSGHIHPDDLAGLSSIKSRWLYLTSLNGEIKTIETLLGWAVENSVKIAWNPGLAEVENHRIAVKKWLKHVSLIIVNRCEAAALIGHDGEVGDLAAEMQKYGMSRAIITDGVEAMAVIDGKTISVIYPEPVKAVDETGAGDAFGSGIVAGLLKGLNFKRSLELGMLNAKHVVTKYGAKTGIVFSR